MMDQIMNNLQAFLKKQFMMFKKYILSLFVGIFIFNNIFSQCFNPDSISFTLSETSEVYPPGDTIQLCVTMNGWIGISTGNNWFEGFGLNLGTGWDTVIPVTYPDDCLDSDPLYGWLFVDSVTSSATGNSAGPGFFYEGPAGPTDGDGDPGNDFGDFGGLECNWEFCVNLVSSDVPGDDLSLSVSIYSDGEMGSWGNDICGTFNEVPEEILPPNTQVESCGCFVQSACNYDSTLNCDDGSCLFPGCNIEIACNFNPDAGCDDGSCFYSGCMDNLACNYDSLAGCDDGSCRYEGCTNLIACNYDSTAGCDDGSCILDPQIIFESESYTICLDETLPLSAIPPFGEWDSQYMVGNSFVGTMPGSFSVGYTGEIYNCSVKDFITINVKSKFERPVITKADTLVDLCEDLNKQFYSVARREGVIYVWNVENVLSVNETNEMAVVWYDTTTNYIVSVYGVDTLNCKSEKTEFYVRTVACSRVYAPNSFTPDNDGVNDIFRVSGIGIYEPRLLIFDKWGNAFFETNDLRRGWNGDNGNGYYSEDGVYNWVIFYKDAQGVPKENNGYVILIR